MSMLPPNMEQPRVMPDLKAFVSLHAEDEPWLATCFVPPPEFERVIGDRSVVIFGESGFGKTTLYHMLRALCYGPEGKPVRLPVVWQPTPPPMNAQNSLALLRQQADQVLDACSMALAEHLAHYSRDFDQAPFWVQARLIWFLQRSVQGDLAIRLGPMLEESPPEGVKLLHQIGNAVVQDIIHDPSPEQMIMELIKGLKRLGLESIWVLNDGLEAWAQSDAELLAQKLTVFLSALSLFERSGLSFKLCLPAHLENSVRRASGIERRRIDVYHLQWAVPTLRQLVEKRLSLVLNQANFMLEDLCNSPRWIDWLERIGGTSPREWLDQVRPLVRYYLEHQLSKPVGEKTWKRLRFEDPPRFWMDEIGRKVTVGGREIPLADLPPKTYDMLRYLYKHSGEVVSKDELYFLVYRGLASIPRTTAEEGFESPKEYAGLVDTSIYRIRQAIEPDPPNPVLLRTVRGHGVCLVSRW